MPPGWFRMRVLNVEELAILLYESGEAVIDADDRITLAFGPARHWSALPEHARDDFRTQAKIILKNHRISELKCSDLFFLYCLCARVRRWPTNHLLRLLICRMRLRAFVLPNIITTVAIGT